MDQAITIGQVLAFLGIVGGIFLLICAIFFVIWLFNPFRTGH